MGHNLADGGRFCSGRGGQQIVSHSLGVSNFSTIACPFIYWLSQFVNYFSKVGSVLSNLSVLPPSLILLILCIITSAISQIASNSATTSMLVMQH